jgi:putative membrane protein
MDNRPTIELIRERGSAMPSGKAIALSTVVGAATAVSTASIAFADDGRGFGDGFGRHRGGGAFLMMLLLLAAVVLLVVLLWRNRHPVPSAVGAPIPPTTPASPTFNAQSILADRLARGEISPDDYRAAVSVLRETSSPA